MNSLCSARSSRPVCRATLQWGSNWGSRRPRPRQRQQQTQDSQPPADPATPLHRACTKLSDAITTAFLDTGLPFEGGTCIPASAIFLEAVQSLGTAADVRLELCYLHARHGGDSTYMRHMLMRVDGQPYDIGSAVTQVTLQATGLDSSVTFEVVHSLPAGVQALGWGTDREAADGAPREASAAAEAGMLQQLGSAHGREVFFSGSPPQMQQARQQVLALSRSLKDTLH